MGKLHMTSVFLCRETCLQAFSHAWTVAKRLLLPLQPEKETVNKDIALNRSRNPKIIPLSRHLTIGTLYL